MNEVYLYPYSVEEARQRSEVSLWRESHKTNILCRGAIESAIRQSFDGMHLDPDCLQPVLDEYGYRRTAWVLANTLHELDYDERFSQSSRQWADHISVPKDPEHNADFIVRSHPAVLDGFIDLYREAEREMWLSELESQPELGGMTMS